MENEREKTRPFTQQEIDRMRGWRECGAPLAAIAARFNTSRAGVWNHVQDIEISRRNGNAAAPPSVLQEFFSATNFPALPPELPLPKWVVNICRWEADQQRRGR